MFNIKIDFSENSTKRGAVWLVASCISLIFLANGDKAASAQVMTGAGLVVGGLGLAISDDERIKERRRIKRGKDRRQSNETQ